MARTFRPNDLKKCDKCHAFFLPYSCPVCNGTKWRWANGLTEEAKQIFYEECVSTTTKAYVINKR